LPREFLAGGTLKAATTLLGTILVREPSETFPGRRVGRIVEVEAYLGPEDRASHARFGRTSRTDPMFGPPGAAYVYLVYGMYDCLNVVTERDGRAGAVLIRAVEPTEGVAVMRTAVAGHRAARRRGIGPGERARQVPDHRLASGPGLVGASFSVERSATGLDLCDPAAPLHLELPRAGARPVALVTGPRIGVAYSGEPWMSLPYRFADASSASVSRPMPHAAVEAAG
jgi:DNA-3-methyladenine glycosylase